MTFKPGLSFFGCFTRLTFSFAFAFALIMALGFSDSTYAQSAKGDDRSPEKVLKHMANPQARAENPRQVKPEGKRVVKSVQSPAHLTRSYIRKVHKPDIEGNYVVVTQKRGREVISPSISKTPILVYTPRTNPVHTPNLFVKPR